MIVFFKIFEHSILKIVLYNLEYWAPHAYFAEQVIFISRDIRKFVNNYYGLYTDRKGVICSASIEGAMVMFSNGTSYYITPIPTYCYPMNAQANIYDLTACMLVIQK